MTWKQASMSASDSVSAIFKKHSVRPSNDWALSCPFAKGLLARPPSRSLSARLDLIDTPLDASTHELVKSEVHARGAALGAAKERAGNLGT